MIQIQEFKSIMTMRGEFPVTLKTAVEAFVDWQATHPEAEIINVQKIDNGLFVVYKKKKEERIEKAVSNFGNKRK